jgi:hypothetical protein
VIQAETQVDTGKGLGATLPRERLDVVKKYFVSTLHIDSNHVRVNFRVISATPPRVTPPSPEQRAKSFRTVTVLLTGRQPLLVGKLESSLIAVKSDERATKSDSLKAGGVTPPFLMKGVFEVVRLNGREASRLKTFEEAQAEVSGQYQDSESERLKDAWLKGLRAKYPVEEHPEVLRSAFASTEK